MLQVYRLRWPGWALQGNVSCTLDQFCPCLPSALITGLKVPIKLHQPPAGVWVKEGGQDYQWNLKKKYAQLDVSPFSGRVEVLRPTLQAEEGAAVKKINRTPAQHGWSFRFVCDIFHTF